MKTRDAMLLGGMVGLLTTGCPSNTVIAPRAEELEKLPVPVQPAMPKPAVVLDKPIPKPAIPERITAKHDLRLREFQKSGINFTMVTFDRRNFDLRVIDQANGPGSTYTTSKDAGKGAVAAVNAGFFNPEGNPIGLLKTRGKSRGVFNKRTFLGTGFFMGPKAGLISRSQYLSSKPQSEELLQTGPRLVWKGEVLTGLKNNSPRPRSFLLWDGENHFAIGHADSATLLGLSKTLQSQPLSGFKVRYALNLDGGRSSDLWVSAQVSGSVVTKRGFFNRTVRNYLVLKRK